jgi:hypothetical protein
MVDDDESLAQGSFLADFRVIMRGNFPNRGTRNLVARARQQPAKLR